MRLDWEGLVAAVRDGNFEPTDRSGKPAFLYSQARNVFISDPDLVKQIIFARRHRHPFMLIGEFGTGKNIFLELVASGGSARPAVECIDENVNGTQGEMLEKFFGPGGMVERHPNSLFHFDLLQNAIEWPVFMDKLHELARKGVLYRTDGRLIRELNVRVVGGATKEISDLVAAVGASSAKYLYDFLATNQLARTAKLGDRRERIDVVLAETLAAQVLDTQSRISRDDVRAIENVSSAEIDQLRKYHWPEGYYELVRFVRRSLIEGRWLVDSLNITPTERLKVFISYSFADAKEVSQVHDWLVEHNIDVWISVESLLPGQDWELEINRAIHSTDLIIVCLTAGVIGKKGYVQTEIRRALDLVGRMPEGEIYLIPLRLEPCELPSGLSRYHYADFFEPEGQTKLLLALRNRATTLGRAAVGSARY